MKAYSYDQDFIFNGVIDCSLDPLETEKQDEDIYLLPRFSTFVSPIEFDESTQELYWRGTNWEVRDKHEDLSQDDIITPEQQRKNAYDTMLYKEGNMPLITWEDIAITVNQANQIYLQYFIEGSAKVSKIQDLIINAKEYIRSLYY